MRRALLVMLLAASAATFVVAQGAQLDYAMLGKILSEMQSAGWSADNIAFGSGGGLLQKLNRDTEKFAFKCDLHRTYIGAIERGERNVSLLNIKKIAEALGMTAWELMKKADI